MGTEQEEIGQSFQMSNGTDPIEENGNELKEDEVHTNVVEAKLVYGKNDVKQNRAKKPLNDYRDVLNITSIRENVELGFGDTVLAWKALGTHQGNSGLIGITPKSIILGVETNRLFRLVKEIELEAEPHGFITFTEWNEVSNIPEIIVVVAVLQNLVFIRVEYTFTAMEIFWMCSTFKETVAIDHFYMEHSNMLVLMSKSANGGSAVNLYSFQMSSKEFWLHQEFRLKIETDNVAHIHAGNDHFLCFAQNSSVMVYKYEWKRFEFYLEIPAKNARITTAFRMGGQSYLAIGGDKPQILRYLRRSFYAQTILARSWGTVESFLPVPCRTFRDDLILLVQHTHDLESHTISVVDALIWNGESFDTALSTPCYVFDILDDHGISCMLDADRETGILGATVIQNEDRLAALVPRHGAPPALFDIYVELVPNFKTNNEQEMLKLFGDVMRLLDLEEQIVQNTTELLKHIDANEVKSMEQSFHSINTIELDLPDSALFNTILSADEAGSDKISMESLTEFLHSLDETQALINSDSDTKAKRQTAQGPLSIGSLETTYLIVENINGVSVKSMKAGDNVNIKINGTLVVNKSITALKVNKRGDQVAALRTNELDSGNANLDMDKNWHINSDLNVEFINGVPWKELAEDVVMKNGPNIHWDRLDIDGVSLWDRFF